MILADKILMLRKNNDLSQEELAEKLGVSRQSISKWESAASIPDIDKIIDMSKLFGVTTDYLLKDDMETAQYADGTNDGPRKIGLEETNAFIADKISYMKKVGLGVTLCILAPVPLITLPVLCGAEELGAGIGMVSLLAIVAAAVAIFIISSYSQERYKFIERGEFELSYGVEGVLRHKLEGSGPRRTAIIAIGVVLCIISPIPLIVAGLTNAGDFVCAIFTALLLVIVSFAAYLFVGTSGCKDAIDMLLRQGDYDAAEVRHNERAGKLGGIYWPLVTAGYLAWSFVTNRWDMTWIVWPVAGVLFGAICAIVKAAQKDCK